MGDIALAVSDLDNLFRAWRDVRSHVAQTSWPQITTEMQLMDAAPLRNLLEIQTALRQQRYQFSPKHGYTKRKSGGSRRGITVHSVRDRIVQRAILNVLYTSDARLKRKLGQIPAALNHPNSFAGTPGKGLPQAIACVARSVNQGARAYVYSDMKDFFPCIPKAEVVGFLRSNMEDDEFTDLFRRALDTELSNPEELKGFLTLFPGPEVGVAQGSLLSVMAGNIAMRRFDEILNTNELTTIRYLDDFITLTKDLVSAEQAFRTAREELARLGMDCYAPRDGSQKAFMGLIAEGFDFLGCRIHPSGVSPSSKNQRKFLRELATIIAEAKKEIRMFKGDHAKRRRTEQAYFQTLNLMDRKIRGWGDAYQFASNRVVFSQMDQVIDKMLMGFRLWFARQTEGVDMPTRRRLSGIALLADTTPQHLSNL